MTTCLSFLQAMFLKGFGVSPDCDCGCNRIACQDGHVAVISLSAGSKSVSAYQNVTTAPDIYKQRGPFYWDYIMSGNSAQRHAAASSVPRGVFGGEYNSGIDIFSSYANGPNPVALDQSKAYIQFFPQ